MKISDGAIMKRIEGGLVGVMENFCNEKISRLIKGKSVLDIGCGHGLLVDLLRRKGFTAVGIDMDPGSLAIAKKICPDADVRLMDVNAMTFKDKEFDTVIFKHSAHHVDLTKALSEIDRVSRGEIIIFDPNPTLLLKVARILVCHKDPELPSEEVFKVLRQKNYYIIRCEFSDLFAMPLSGGFVGLQLFPNSKMLYKQVIRLDESITKMLGRMKLGRHLCWRYLIHAEKR